MNDQSPHESSVNEDSRWPTTAMLAYGTFGMGTPAGRRYHIRSSIALAAMAAGFLAPALLRHSVSGGILRIIIALAPGAAFAYIAWEFRRYLSTLDELARRIQLESIAWTYLCGLAVAMLLGGVGFVYGWRFNPAWLIVLEPMRAGWLYFVSRRYQ